MNAAELLDHLNALPEGGRSDVFAPLVENGKWRHDLLDLITILERRAEPDPPDR